MREVKKAVENFNRFRSPEANATIVEISEKKVIIRFEGPFMNSCCLYDYFDDLIHFGLDGEIKEIKDGGDHFLVIYSLKNELF
ncbi:MAG: hypothetical protein H5T46_01490 [Archaeoglobi archaeon]|nr:hypothetical protein [Candidatus Mnemosynella sp.]